MMPTIRNDLYLFVSEQPDMPVRCVLVEHGTILYCDTYASIDDMDMTAVPSDAILTLILPGERALSKRLDIPTKSLHQFQQAARFALEDELAVPIEEQHIAFTPPDQTGARLVVVIEKTYLDRWLKALQNRGIDAHKVTLDYLCLGEDPEKAIVLLTNDRLVGRVPSGGFAADASLCWPLLSQVMEEDAIQQLDVLGLCNSMHVPESFKEHGTVKTSVLENKAQLDEFYIKNMFLRPPLDLRQGIYKTHTNWISFIRPWYGAMVLGAICGVLWLALIATQGVRAHNAAQILMKDARAAYIEIFPESRVVNLRAQARQHLANTSAQHTHFLPLVAHLTKSLQANDALVLLALDYDRKGVLKADLRFAAPGVLDAFKTQIRTSGIIVREGRDIRRDTTGQYIGQVYLEVEWQ